MLLDGIDQKEDDDEEEGSISEDSATSAVHIGTQMTGIDEDDCVNLDIIDDDDIFQVVNTSGEDDLKTNQQIELTELPIKKENIVINIRDEIDINTTDDLTGNNI